MKKSGWTHQQNGEFDKDSVNLKVEQNKLRNKE